jgi:flagella basal body P-ring formation protein FlgA
MVRRPTLAIVFVLLALPLALALAPPSASAWTLDLAAEATVTAGNVTVADLARGEVPPAAGTVVVVGGTRPGHAFAIDRRTILRRLVMAGQADAVSLTGAASCHVSVTGAPVPPDALERRIQDLLAPYLPPSPEGAPPTWLEVDLTSGSFATDGGWTVAWPDAAPLAAGRNLLTVALRTAHGTRQLSVTATVHTYGLTPRVVSALTRGQTLRPDLFGWTWTDLATLPGGAITDSTALRGMILGRDVAPGRLLTDHDLEPRPLVRRGEQVDLVVRRGRVAAVVRAECRQDGRQGQLVSVLNPLTRRLVLASVSAPGVVTLGR